MIIGIPREILNGEKRVAATPETVRKMRERGWNVVIEKSAGLGSLFADEDYRDAGADTAEDIRDLYRRANLLLKVKQPMLHPDLDIHEADLLSVGQILVCFLHPASPANHDMVRRLAKGGVLALTLDCVPRISRAQSMDALTSMSTVAGYKAALLAADRLPKFVPMMSTAAGMIRPAEALVIGAGVAGLQALATLKRLGAVVKATDIRPAAAEQAASLGAKTVDSGVPADLAVGNGGYANQLPEDWVEKERAVLGPAVAAADILILTALVPGRRAPALVTAEMVETMKAGSVIVDVAIDQGGNCKCSISGEIVDHHGVCIVGTPNIPGMMPMSATRLFAENAFNFLDLLLSDGRPDLSDEIVAPCVVTREGEIVHQGTKEAMNA
jgi:NAD(P) transhydrogenase subunit alpha